MFILQLVDLVSTALSSCTKDLKMYIIDLLLGSQQYGEENIKLAFSVLIEMSVVNLIDLIQCA